MNAITDVNSLTTANAVPSDLPYRIGPFAMVRAMAKRVVRDETYVIVVYGAYNALGLIGSEKNGVAVLNETRKVVACDEIERASSGYFGATKAQMDMFDRMQKMSAPEFVAFVRRQPGFRGDGI